MSYDLYNRLRALEAAVKALEAQNAELRDAILKLTENLNNGRPRQADPSHRRG